MPLHAEELSRFFDRSRRDWEHLWNRLVDLEQMSEQTRDLNLHRADEIGAIRRF
jgi:ActR/RegA family two-component response regulator